MTQNIPHLLTWYNYEIKGEISIRAIEKKWNISNSTLYKVLNDKPLAFGVSQKNLDKIFAWAAHLGYDSQKVYELKTIN